MKTVFLRAIEADDKGAAVLAAVHSTAAALGKQRFEIDARTFFSVPRSPFAYWVSERVIHVFSAFPSLLSAGFEAWVGLQTNYDFRWLRLSWECPFATMDRLWVPFAKGGAFSPFYASIHLRVAWKNSGSDLKSWKLDQLRLGRITANNSRCWNEGNYFRAGLTWPSRTQGGLSLRAMPAGCIFGHKGPGAFVRNDSVDDLLVLLAISNSSPFRAMVEMQMAFGSYEVGVLQRTPIPHVTEDSPRVLARLGRTAWLLKRSLDTRTETSYAFTLPALLQIAGADIATRVAAWVEHARRAEAELASIQADIDERCFELYGVDETDRVAIKEGFGDCVGISVNADTMQADDDGSEGAEGDDSASDAAGLGAELVAWAVGVAFGRFDICLATGARLVPSAPEPFDALAACSPGMLTGDDGLPLAMPPTAYPLPFPETGVLVDDAGHSQDLTAALRVVFDVVFGADAELWWHDVAVLLDPKGHDVRGWLAGSFFDHHLKRYSRSRRRAPILWQLSTPSGRYSVWLYAHRLTRDSFFQLQNEVIGPKLAHEERQLTGLVQSAGSSPSMSQRKDIATQESFLNELRTLHDEIKGVAPLWNPNLDDGVVLTMAPLWRLVSQHKGWQKELKAKWDELAAGEYDWAHVAMHLWPARVVPKCATDRSLAMAHGLEEVFWEKDEGGQWRGRDVTQRVVEKLVTERTSPAVKDALQRLQGTTGEASGGARERHKRTRAKQSAQVARP